MKRTEEIAASVFEKRDTYQKQHRARRRTALSLSVIVLAAVIGLGIWKGSPTQSRIATDTNSTVLTSTAAPGVHIPKMEITMPNTHAQFSWANAFLIYQGNTYIDTQTMDMAQFRAHGLLGQKLGVTTGTDDEVYWSQHPEAYQMNFASNIGESSEIYTVNGYDPSFRLAVVWAYTEYSGEDHSETTGEQVFIVDCLNGVTLHTGKDVFTDRLHLSERMVSAESQSHADWDNGKQRFYPLETITAEQWNAFFEALDAAPFTNADNTAPDIFKTAEQKHLIFTLSDGLSVTLRLFADGHVSLNGSRYMVQMNRAAFDLIFQACQP